MQSPLLPTQSSHTLKITTPISECCLLISAKHSTQSQNQNQLYRPGMCTHTRNLTQVFFLWLPVNLWKFYIISCNLKASEQLPVIAHLLSCWSVAGSSMTANLLKFKVNFQTKFIFWMWNSHIMKGGCKMSQNTIEPWWCSCDPGGSRMKEMMGGKKGKAKKILWQCFVKSKVQWLQIV